eukprot:m.97404 g.97404  ORF g.97404 m.97404 type:complete len:353 (+) comp22040_c0_seq3:95-1153(+)
MFVEAASTGWKNFLVTEHGMTFCEFPFIFGGLTPNGAHSNELYQVLVEKNHATWIKVQQLEDIPQARSGQTLVARNKKLYLMGGGSNSWLQDLHEFDIGSRLWRRLPDMPKKIGFPVAAIVGSYIYCAGYQYDGSMFAMFMFDIERESWEIIHATNPPSPRTGFSLTAIGRHLVLIGGQSYGGGIPLSDVMVFDTEERHTWVSQPTSRDVFRTGHAAGRLHQKEIIICGGVSSEKDAFSAAPLILDTATWTWVAPLSPTNPVAGYMDIGSCVLPDGRLCLFGGRDTGYLPMYFANFVSRWTLATHGQFWQEAAVRRMMTSLMWAAHKADCYLPVEMWWNVFAFFTWTDFVSK